jgi:hypothetical protein
MAKKPDFDVTAAHKYFSAHCFNAAWDLIDKESRTEEENLLMVALCQASIWHWTQREDCTDKNLSIGYWQASRIYALLGRHETARMYGRLSLDHAKDAEPFFVAYAYEALARAESVAGNDSKRDDYLSQARKLTEQVKDADSKKMLEADLDTIA